MQPFSYTVHSDKTVNIEYPIEYQKLANQKLTLFITDVSSDNLLSLILFLNSNPNKFNIYFFYMPFGRQDREQIITKNNKDFIRVDTLKSFMSLLIEKGHNIYTDDAHSKAFLSYSGNEIPQLECIQNFQKLNYTFNKSLFEINLVVSPDEGAKNKSQLVANYLNQPLLCATKERDPITNKIKLSSDFTRDQIEDKVIGIFDDIMDYGTSVHDLSMLLKDLGAKKIIVYITNGLCPINKRIVPPSRFSFILKYVDELYFYNLKDAELESNSKVKFNSSI